MSAENINGAALIAEPADWTDKPQWTLKWDTEIAPTLRGNEGRSALRENPRPVIMFSVKPMRIDAQARLSAALIAGMASGQACAPTWGRASWLSADVAAGASTIQIDPPAWFWAVNDWLLIYTADGGHQTAQINAIDPTGVVFTLAAPLTGSITAASAVYPLFFGRVDVEAITQINGSISSATITLVGDNYAISDVVPPVCQPPDVPPAAVADLDYGLVTFQYNTDDNGEDLYVAATLATPAVSGIAGIIAPGDIQGVPETSGDDQYYLAWVGAIHNPDGSSGGLQILIGFRAILEAFPLAPSVVVTLLARWGEDVYDGQMNISARSYRGGALDQDENNAWSNVGGTMVQDIATVAGTTFLDRLVDANYAPVATLTYTRATGLIAFT